MSLASDPVHVSCVLGMKATRGDRACTQDELVASWSPWWWNFVLQARGLGGREAGGHARLGPKLGVPSQDEAPVPVLELREVGVFVVVVVFLFPAPGVVAGRGTVVSTVTSTAGSHRRA